ncbi:amidohydrolase [Paenibacillus sp. J5C_2022]|uniref:amidohydrolase family protein n=1 Tax=Paenibacillus sp. J5C2022 TaxID=2977129 RepID=UPI0021CF01EA|nr:amidohydrolase family protein [Paenibacillus sp. J5C2022]MCU6709071.1 amidohydrolase [Paenibacillus sp. J5C2022]
MHALFEMKEVDKIFYEEKLKDFLPDRMIDIHTHVWLDHIRLESTGAPVRAVTWPSLVARDNSIADLFKTYEAMFPGKEVTPLIFSQVSLQYDIAAGNEYIRSCAEQYKLPSLMVTRPQQSAADFEEGIDRGGFLGCKVYLNFADPYIPEKEIRIYDFLPPHQLEVLNRRGWMVMLHIPRDGRLKDPVNLAQMLEIERKYPAVKLIIAHVGRAYCPEDVGDAFDLLAETRNMVFDFSANTNSHVFRELIKAVGPKRILFGSDLPIVKMRMKRYCENGRYVNVVPKGLYGDVSGDPNMREVEGREAEELSFFMYEEIDAFRVAAEAEGLTKRDVEDIFYSNAKALIDQIEKERRR